MTEVLLRELENSDIDWLITIGRHEEIVAGTILVQPEKPVDEFYIILEGSVTATIAHTATADDPLALAFSALEGSEATGREIIRLATGEIVGEECLLDGRPPAFTLKALQKSLVLAIPRQPLVAKLKQDVSFAAHFYRAVAGVLSDRLRSIIRELGNNRFSQGSPLREILFVFGELSDSDIDWLISTGRREKIPAGTAVISKGRPVNGLYILLDGAMAVSISEEEQDNPLALVFASIEEGEAPGREIARLLRGDIAGEMHFVDAHLPATTVKALRDSIVLMIPQQQLAIKLQEDVVFASHFYRVIAILISDRLRGMVSRLGYARRVYDSGQSLNEDVEYEGELDLHTLDNFALAGNRFDWLLRRLNVKGA
ncbi:cyclic nucleotide-binding domain-containing protein [Leptolyngbya sp. FACHB-261]|nr:cyclic nucleotide-binding domain-containing protein [Leptolyngbya sp. FACHB-261]